MPIQKKPTSRATKPQQRQSKPKVETAAPAPETAPAPADDALFDVVDAVAPATPATPVEPAAPPAAPAAPVEEPAASGASEPAVVEPTVADPIDPPAETQAPEEEPEPAVDDGSDDEELSGSPVEANLVRLGHVEGVLHRIPLAIVQEIVASSGERIALLQSSNAVQALQKRVLETEGRCAPVIFMMDEAGKVPSLFSGIETIAAAINVELEHLIVVAIAAADAGAAQSYLAQAPHRANPETEDDLVRQVLSYQYE